MRNMDLLAKWRNRNIRRKYYSKGMEVHGHTFYVVDDPLMMPVHRALSLHNLLNEFDMKVTHDDIQTCCEIAIKSFDEGKYSHAAWAMQTLLSYSNLYLNNKVMFRIADVLILVDDEPAEHFSQEHTSLKEKLFRSSDVVRGFFLSTTWSSLVSTGNTLKDFDAEAYLKTKRVKLAEQALISLIGSDTLRATEPEPTK